MKASKKRFDVRRVKFGSYVSSRLNDNVTGEFVNVLPFLGGAINNIVLQCNNERLNIVDGYSSITDVEKNLKTSFKGSNLFPFPNRIAAGTYRFAAQLHQLPLNFPHEDNAIHGFVYDKKFEIVEEKSGEEGCRLTLRYLSPDRSVGYPFKFLLEQVYSLSESKGFRCTTEIVNLTRSPLPIGHGWHPYFKLGTAAIDELYLQFPAQSMLEVDSRMIPTGQSQKYSEFNQLREIGKRTFDNCYRLDTKKKYAETHLRNVQKGLHLRIWQEVGKGKYNFLQLYTPPSRTSIAIEPMSCAPDAFNSGDGLVDLQPAESTSLSWGVSTE